MSGSKEATGLKEVKELLYNQRSSLQDMNRNGGDGEIFHHSIKTSTLETQKIDEKLLLEVIGADIEHSLSKRKDRPDLVVKQFTSSTQKTHNHNHHLDSNMLRPTMLVNTRKQQNSTMMSLTISKGDSSQPVSAAKIFNDIDPIVG